MNKQKNNKGSVTIYYRLVAAWAVCEGMIGGIIHGFRLPVSGLVVGSSAVVCISLIAWYYPHRGAILKATFLVVIFKIMLSPHASFPAYIAVFFQGFMGELIFRGRRNHGVRCLGFALIALTESGLQRILVLTIIYGNDLWRVVNDFVNELTGQSRPVNYSLLFAGIYVAVHIVAGIVVGRFASRLPQLSAKPIGHRPEPIAEPSTALRSRRKKIKYGVLIAIWLLLIFLLFRPESYHRSARILIRSAVVVVSWLIFLGPFMKYLLNRWLAKKRSSLATEIAAINEILPSVTGVFRSSWLNSASRRGMHRIVHFCQEVFRGIVSPAQQVIIVTGSVNSGKTSFLFGWLKDKDAGGIITPKSRGTRVFRDIRTGEEFPMESADDNEVMSVGRFNFSRRNFEKATGILRNEINNCHWLVIDEVGPLEMRNEGFSQVVEEALRFHEGNLVLVVRESILDQVLKKYGIMSYQTISPQAIHANS